jgi:aspartyl-tRNA(Asn)/glutamyl-tRNA(Gln) amidotransferase subunit A
MSTQLRASARQIAREVRAGTRRAVDVVREALVSAKECQARCNAFTQLFEEKALAHAAIVDRNVASGGGGGDLALAGVPIAIKDNICLGPDLLAAGDGLGYGGQTTCASAMLRDYRSPFTATSAQRAIAAGAIVIGKTNMDEFGMGSSTERSIFGATRNPHDTTRVAGGSSGGSAAAVAFGCCALALGSDTGGSVRQPASFCGVVGVKPTYGRVSRWGLVAYASSLDQVGVLAKDVHDAALCLSVISGHDPLDATSADRPDTNFTQDLDAAIPPPRLGVPRQALAAPGLHACVRDAFEQAIAHCRSAGATIVDIDLPLLDAAVAAYYIVAPAEASSNLARYDGVRYGHRAAHPASLLDLYTASRSQGFGEEVQRRILLGTHVLRAGFADAYYQTASKLRTRLRADFDAAFLRCDAVMTPTAPGPAFALGAKTSDPLAMYLEDVFTVPANLAGLPAMSLRMGMVTDAMQGVGGGGNASLPVGLQILCPAFAETTMLRLATWVAGAGVGVSVPPDESEHPSSKP